MLFLLHRISAVNADVVFAVIRELIGIVAVEHLRRSAAHHVSELLTVIVKLLIITDLSHLAICRSHRDDHGTALRLFHLAPMVKGTIADIGKHQALPEQIQLCAHLSKIDRCTNYQHICISHRIHNRFQTVRIGAGSGSLGAFYFTSKTAPASGERLQIIEVKELNLRTCILCSFRCFHHQFMGIPALARTSVDKYRFHKHTFFPSS